MSDELKALLGIPTQQGHRGGRLKHNAGAITTSTRVHFQNERYNLIAVLSSGDDDERAGIIITCQPVRLDVDCASGKSSKPYRWQTKATIGTLPPLSAWAAIGTGNQINGPWLHMQRWASVIAYGRQSDDSSTGALGLVSAVEGLAACQAHMGWTVKRLLRSEAAFPTMKHARQKTPVPRSFSISLISTARNEGHHQDRGARIRREAISNGFPLPQGPNWPLPRYDSGETGDKGLMEGRNFDRHCHLKIPPMGTAWLRSRRYCAENQMVPRHGAPS